MLCFAQGLHCLRLLSAGALLGLAALVYPSEELLRSTLQACLQAKLISNLSSIRACSTMTGGPVKARQSRVI